MKARVRIPTSRKAEPRNVYRKDLEGGVGLPLVALFLAMMK